MGFWNGLGVEVNMAMQYLILSFDKDEHWNEFQFQSHENFWNKKKSLSHAFYVSFFFPAPLALTSLVALYARCVLFFF